MWFRFKTLPFTVHPGSRSRIRSWFLPCWLLWEWVSNWINLGLPPRSFNWGLLLGLKTGHGNPRGKKWKRTCQSKSVSKQYWVSHTKERLKQSDCPVFLRNQLLGLPNVRPSQESAPFLYVRLYLIHVSAAAWQQQLAKWKRWHCSHKRENGVTGRQIIPRRRDPKASQLVGGRL